MQITEDIREWDYGDYEGVTSPQIKEQRQKAGLGPWDIWRDGCPGGEYVSLPFCRSSFWNGGLEREVADQFQEPRTGHRTH